jgi:hypothetical protein
MIIDIPGGQATFRTKVKNVRQQREILYTVALNDDLLGGDQDQLTAVRVKAGVEARDKMVLAFLESWTLEDPLPTTVDDLLELSPDVYEPLASAAQEIYQNVMNTLMNFGSSPDPKVTTNSSSDSSGTSKDELPATTLALNTQPLNSTTNIDSEN